MKKILVEYSNIMAYTISGLVFGFAFFLLFLNLYHYKDVNDLYNKQDSDYQINTEIKEKINKINENINSVNLNITNQNYTNLSVFQTKLNICMDKISNSKLDNILQKETVSISDGYEELIKFLDRQKDKLTLIYLYKKDVVSSEEIKEAQNIQISDLDKQKIKEIWEKQDKNIIENKQLS